MMDDDKLSCLRQVCTSSLMEVDILAMRRATGKSEENVAHFQSLVVLTVESRRKYFLISKIKMNL